MDRFTIKTKNNKIFVKKDNLQQALDKLSKVEDTFENNNISDDDFENIIIKKYKDEKNNKNITNEQLNEKKLNFYELAKEIHKDRIRDEFWQKHNIDNRARQEYSIFCVWCKAFKDGDFSKQNFKLYKRQEHKHFDFWLNKRIAELFYDYEFEFDYDTMKWKSHKKSH